jgi:CRP/FNR family transcriptional regulator, cyclic AMP receptor protein
MSAPRIARGGPGQPMGVGLLSTVRSERLWVIREDADLAERLAPERRRQAEELSVARVLRREPGTWDARHDASIARDGLGLLVVDGLLVRRVGFGGRYGAELLGPGDVLRPWEHDGEEAVLPFESTWRILRPLRLAVLDLPWATRMGPFPEIYSELLSRSQRRSRRLASMLVITQQRRLEDTLWMFFWEVANRYGRVRPDGVHVGLRLTHELIGYLVGAQRPSVSTALGRMQAAGRIRRDRGAWILLGEPPSYDG